MKIHSPIKWQSNSIIKIQQDPVKPSHKRASKQPARSTQCSQCSPCFGYELANQGKIYHKLCVWIHGIHANFQRFFFHFITLQKFDVENQNIILFIKYISICNRTNCCLCERVSNEVNCKKSHISYEFNWKRAFNVLLSTKKSAFKFMVFNHHPFSFILNAVSAVTQCSYSFAKKKKKKRKKFCLWIFENKWAKFHGFRRFN